MHGEGREGSRTGFLRDPAQQRQVSSRLEGDQSPWKYRVCVTGNGGTHYGLVSGETPWSRSAPGRNHAQASACRVHVGALTAGLLGTDTPSGVHRPIRTDHARRPAPGNRSGTTGPNRPRRVAARNPRCKASKAGGTTSVVRGPTIQRAFGPAGSGSRDRRRQSSEGGFGLIRCGVYRPVPPTHGGSSSFNRTKRESWSPAPLAVHGVGIERVASAVREEPAASSFATCSPAWVGVTSHLDRIALRCETAKVGDDNGKRATAAGMRYGCRRVECFEGYEPRCGERHDRSRLGARSFGIRSESNEGDTPGNAMNPVRIGLQYARSLRAEETVEVVEIHEGGTRCAAGGAGTPKEGGNTDRE